MNLASLGFKILNPVINTVLRSPLHFLISRRLMTVEYEGIKSKKKFLVPVSYFTFNNDIYCFTDGKWWHNFKVSRNAALLFKGERKHVSTLAIRHDRESFFNVLSSLIERFPSDARYYGVELGYDNIPLNGELDKAFSRNVMIKFTETAL